MPIFLVDFPFRVFPHWSFNMLCRKSQIHGLPEILKLHGLVPPHLSTIVSFTDVYASKTRQHLGSNKNCVCHIVQPYNISSTICVIFALCFCGQNYGWGYQSNHIIIPARSSMISPIIICLTVKPQKKTRLMDGWILWKPHCCWWNHNEMSHFCHFSGWKQHFSQVQPALFERFHGSTVMFRPPQSPLAAAPEAPRPTWCYIQLFKLFYLLGGCYQTTHTWSETSYRIIGVECIVRAQTIQ